jgi:hypothetical protein
MIEKESLEQIWGRKMREKEARRGMDFKENYDGNIATFFS